MTHPGGSAIRAMVRLAESIIDEVLRTDIRERQGSVYRAQVAVDARRRDLEAAQREFDSAHRDLAAAQRDLRRWRISREFGHHTGIRALHAAEVADFVPSAVPPGTHRRAVADYLRGHPPVWPVARARGVSATIRRATDAAGGGIRNAPGDRPAQADAPIPTDDAAVTRVP